jgi:hypothetical protein
MATKSALGSSRVTWRSAALRLGEHLAAAGPNGYYDFTPAQWLEWVLAQPCMKSSDPCGEAEEMLAALKGVVRVADRKTAEFDAARAAIAKAEGK